MDDEVYEEVIPEEDSEEEEEEENVSKDKEEGGEEGSTEPIDDLTGGLKTPGEGFAFSYFKTFISVV